MSPIPDISQSQSTAICKNHMKSSERTSKYSTHVLLCGILRASKYISYIRPIISIFVFWYSNLAEIARRKMIESNELSCRSVAYSASNNQSIFGDDHRASFYRSSSFTDIARQTSEHELCIILHRDDTLWNKISPSLSKQAVKVKCKYLELNVMK